MTRKVVFWKVFHQQPKLAQKLDNDANSLSYRPLSYFMRKINAYNYLPYWLVYLSRFHIEAPLYTTNHDSEKKKRSNGNKKP